MNDEIEKFVTPRRAAIRLGLPVAWFEGVVRRGEVPFLQAGNRRLIDVASARAALVKRVTVQEVHDEK